MLDPALDLTVFRRMADLSSDAFYLCDARGRFLFVNDRSLAMTGFTRAELLRLSVADINPEFPQARFDEFVAAMPSGSFLPPFETITRAKSGLVFPIEICVARLDRRPGETYLFGVVRDIRQRKQLELARRTFARRMLQTLEAERERVARELREDVGTVVGEVAPALDELERRPGVLGAEAGPTLVAIRATLAQIAESTTRVAREHRPADLLGRGLEEAVRVHAEQFAARHGLRLRLRTAPAGGLLPAEHELHVFRIVQEAIANVARHARARDVEVELAPTATHLAVAVRDDGVGFPAEGARTGFGLVTMRERAALMGADLALASAPGRTEVSLRVPLRSGPAGGGVPAAGA